METHPKEYRIYLDETGICHKLQRTHGYGTKGSPVRALTCGKRKKRTNVIGAWHSEAGLFATQSYEKNINKDRFLTWVREKLCPHLGCEFVVIMDNAPWHKGSDIKSLIEGTGANLVMLPPYSPDLNPIEKAWANLKNAIKTHDKNFRIKSENIAAQIRRMNHFNLA